MKRSALYLLLALCIGTTVLGFAACAEQEEQPEEGVTVSVQPQNWTMKQYEDVLLEASVTNADGTPAQAQVTWSSSDASVAAVAADGSVIAYRAGEAVITASAGDASDSCSVTVEEATSLPALVVYAQESLPLTVNETFPLEPYVLYEEVIYRDAEFTYSSGDEAVFTVSEEGEIRAVGAGTANLTVQASWRGLEGTALAASLPVTVNEDVQVFVNGEDAQIYSAAVQIAGQQFVNTVQYFATVMENGVEVSSPELEWKSSDTDVATVADGLVTGVSEGTATITASYTSAIGREYTSQAVQVSVTFPVADLQTYHTDLDLSGETVSLDAQAILGSGQSIAAVYDVTNTRTQVANTGKVLEKDDLVTGDRTLEVRGGTYGCLISASVVTKIITTAQELSMFRFTGSEQFDGYYILGSNIDATEYSHSTQSWGGGSYPYGGYGLTGIFDGRGYIIDGITLSNGGLFGAIGTGGIVRNVAFTNAVLFGTGNVTLLAHYACAGSVVDNVFVQVASWNSAGTISALLVQFKNNTTTPAAPITLSNIFVITPAAGAGGTYSALFASASDVGAHLTERSNIYVISPAQLSSTDAVYSGVTQYATVDEYAAAGESHEDSGFNSYWTFDEEYPMFANAPAYVQTYFEYIGNTLSLDAGEIYTLHPSFAASLSGVGDAFASYVTLSGNDLSIALALPEDTTFQVVLSFAGVEDTHTISVTVTAIDKTLTSVETSYDHLHESEAPLTVQIAPEYLTGAQNITVTAGETTQQLALSEGAVAIPSAMLDALPAGRNTVTVETLTHILNYVNIYNVTAIITDAQDLQIFNYRTVNTFNGYYILGNNIDATEYTHFTQGWGSSYGTNGLIGEFDGRGYTIKGISFGPGGLFGAIGYGGIVRNVAFQDVVIDGANSTLLANYACANAVIDNVSVSVANWGAGGNTNMSCLILQLKADQPASAEVKNPVSISNVFIVAPESSAVTSYSRHGVLFSPSQSALWVMFDNVIIVSSYAQAKDASDGAEVTYTGVTQYESETAHREANVDYSQSGFNSYWTLEQGEIPVFTSSIEEQGQESA